MYAGCSFAGKNDFLYSYPLMNLHRFASSVLYFNDHTDQILIDLYNLDISLLSPF